MRKLIVLFSLCIICNTSFTQDVRTIINGYGHLDFGFEVTSDSDMDSYVSLGEHNLFINSIFKNNISFLGEFTIQFSSLTPISFLTAIKRARLKFQYYKNHSIIVGKINTPVNYWNDVYHYGRLFFPTIQRPDALSYFTPLHTLGFRLQGQNLGKYNFGYDVVVGSGLAQNDNSIKLNIEPSLTVAAHIKPIEGMRIGLAYYYNFLSDASTNTSHLMHASCAQCVGYKGELDFHLVNSSIAYFSDKFELLNEFSYNGSYTDKADSLLGGLGLANNFSNYLYAGIRIKDKYVPYLAVDIIIVDENDLHVGPFNSYRFIMGYKHEFSNNINIKTQLEYNFNLDHFSHGVDNQKLGFKIQCAYGF